MTDQIEFKAYSPSGPVALLPSAFGLSFAVFSQPPAPFALVADGKAAVVNIGGPLTLNDPFCDTYAAITSRVEAALASDAKTLVLRINSPGGDVFGCFDCSRGLRARAAAAGKKLITFSEASMCSSAYALGCAGSEIVISDTASIGSIGVIATAMDLSRQDAALGLGVALITSGARKADGNPHTPFTDEARAAMQVSVDAMAGVFWEHVGQMRSGRLDAAGARALEAGVSVGSAAVTAGLADSIASWDQLVARLGSEDSNTQRATLAKSMAEPDNKDKDEKKEDAVRASLVTASTCDDPKKASRAKAALKAYDDGEDEKATAPAAPAKAESDDDEKKALRASVAALSASVQEMQATQAATEAKAKAEADAKALAERASFLASRPDLTKEQLEAFAPLSLGQIKAIVATLPPSRTFHNPLVTRATSVTGDGSQTPSMVSAETAEYLDNAMGLKAQQASVVHNDGAIQRFGVRVSKADK